MLYFILTISCFLFHSASSAPSLNSTNGDVAPCLKQFYQVAYDGEYNCTKDLPLFSDNPLTQQSSFVTGKSCFLEVAKEECSVAQYNLLSTKYEEFLGVITKAPTGEVLQCSNPYFIYNALKCGPLISDLQIQSATLTKVEMKANDTRMINLIDTCHKVVSCYDQLCYTSKIALDNYKRACEEFELRNSEFSACLNKIKKQSPDLSEYACLEGTDFYEPGIESAIEGLTTRKDCLKKIMIDNCGEKAVGNFENDVAVGLRALKFLTQVNSVRDNQL